MKDIDSFITLYQSVGIALAPEHARGEYSHIHPDIITKLVLRVNDSQVIGYRHCITELYFDKDGQFVAQGIWED